MKNNKENNILRKDDLLINHLMDTEKIRKIIPHAREFLNYIFRDPTSKIQEIIINSIPNREYLKNCELDDNIVSKIQENFGTKHYSRKQLNESWEIIRAMNEVNKRTLSFNIQTPVCDSNNKIFDYWDLVIHLKENEKDFGKIFLYNRTKTRDSN